MVSHFVLIQHGFYIFALISILSFPKISHKYYVGSLLWFDCVPQSSYVRNLIPNATNLGSGATKKQLGHEGSALMNGLMSLLQMWVSYCELVIKSSLAPLLLSWPLFSFQLPLWEDTARKLSPDVDPKFGTTSLQNYKISISVLLKLPSPSIWLEQKKMN